MNLSSNWNYPTSIRFGVGRINELATLCKELDISNPLIVTDEGLAKLPLVANIVSILNNAKLTTTVFSDVKPNPTGENISAGVKAYENGQHNGVIALGGGSGLDAGKAVALMVGQRQPIWDFEDVGDNWTRVNTHGMAPTIAIPTTAGTGSEVGRASVIVDTATHSKKIIFHPNMLPQQVLCDPELTVGLPKHLTAATGMDALAHNLEAFCASGYHPMADGIALEGIRLIHRWLTTAYNDPSNLDARSHMLTASLMGATAFQKGLGATHAIAHPLGALYDAHHGLLNAILMPYIIIRNRPAIEDKLAHLARYIGLEKTTFDGVLQWLIELRHAIGIPNDLKQIGIDDNRKAEIGRLAHLDPSAAGNPISLTEKDYETLFCHAVNGTL